MPDKRSPGMVIDLRPGDCLSFSGAATLEMIHKSGQASRLRVVAASDVQITKEHAAERTEHVPSMATCIPS